MIKTFAGVAENLLILNWALLWFTVHSATYYLHINQPFIRLTIDYEKLISELLRHKHLSFQSVAFSRRQGLVKNVLRQACDPSKLVVSEIYYLLYVKRKISGGKRVRTVHMYLVCTAHRKHLYHHPFLPPDRRVEFDLEANPHTVPHTSATESKSDTNEFNPHTFQALTITEWDDVRSWKESWERVRERESWEGCDEFGFAIFNQVITAQFSWSSLRWAFWDERLMK